jgi:hypothetical protein
VDRVGHLIDGVKAIDLDDLEGLVQQAHECDIHQVTDPLEPFPITRQALRMFWMFRRNIETVDVRVEVDE